VFTYVITTTFVTAVELFYPANRYYIMITTTKEMINTVNQRNIIMYIRTLAASVLALGLLAPVANAMDGSAGSEVNNHVADYGMQYRKNMPVLQSTKALKVLVLPNGRRASVGDFIDETTEETNQRSSK
jgi:hypothetical protein